MNKILKIAHVILLFLIGIVLVFWSFFNSIIPLDFKQVLGITIGIFTSLILIYESKYFNKILIKNTGIIHTDLVKAIQEAYSKNESIKTLRIFAMTTYIIQPIIKALDKSISDCKILVYKPDNNSRNHFVKDYNNNLEVIIKEWMHFFTKQNNGIINIKKYNFTPTNYMLIFNEKNIIIGNYIVNDERHPFCETQEPIIIDNSNPENKLIIEKYINSFDSIFNSNKSI